jgi:hypothetical protein
MHGIRVRCMAYVFDATKRTRPTRFPVPHRSDHLCVSARDYDRPKATFAHRAVVQCDVDAARGPDGGCALLSRLVRPSRLGFRLNPTTYVEAYGSSSWTKHRAMTPTYNNNNYICIIIAKFVRFRIDVAHRHRTHRAASTSYLPLVRFLIEGTATKTQFMVWILVRYSYGSVATLPFRKIQRLATKTRLLWYEFWHDIYGTILCRFV